MVTRSTARPVAAPLALLLLLIACAPVPQAQPTPGATTYQPAVGDVQHVPRIGDVGVWMMTGNLRPSTWLDQPYHSRTLREPVNVVLIDRAARTPDEASSRLLGAMSAAGYPPRSMHSDGYWGLLNGEFRPQFPRTGRSEAFSDGPAYTSNNHGRLFGPWKIADGYVFTGAFSREDLSLLPTPHHTYNSFQVAREDLAARLTARSIYRRSSYLNLGSRVETPMTTTGDHDGRAVLLIAVR
ncbi:hypothetical protein E7T09_05615 [Deinococcus sp. KSM4-11]|uniref:hypothetical protein n=1 Tax=Deinococcus sp. KSM4-11 TaxID=2568654 RepID=UPI0010A55EA2|nr:hypothetical protein [Deinococcus sp. KSM4-11]THF88663.1 hypothetical protein E7T09_05615 [Deinococcus sp. KSM4-11]